MIAPAYADKSECLCVREMTAVKMESTQAQKEVLTSFVGEVLGPTVGLDDGCSEDRDQEISCVSESDVHGILKLKKSGVIESTNNRSSSPP